MSDQLEMLISRFKKANLSDYPDVTTYDYALDAALWALWVYQDKLKEPGYLAAAELSEILATCKVSFKPREITNAFNRANKKIDARTIGGNIAYKIMHKGIVYLQAKNGDSNIEVTYFDGSKPHSDRKKLKDLVKTKGEIKIVDPYYGIETLDILEQIDNKKPIRFLSENLSGNAGNFGRELAIFKKQFKNIELRQYPNKQELHDRYIITDEALILVGHWHQKLGRSRVIRACLQE